MSGICTLKNYTVMTRALVNSHLLTICSWLELRGKIIDGKLCSSGEERKDGKDYLYVHACVALLMMVSVKLMAVVPWKYYYY